VKISKVDLIGQLNLKFSDPMNLILLANETYNDTDHLRYKYLLSEIHMSLKVKSGGVVEDSMLMFEWYALNITDSLIFAQILFKNTT
jgi:hypothetical protein